MGLVMAMFGSGCAEGAKLVGETSTGGVVTYPYKEDRGGAMFSRFRGEAIEAMKKKCPSGYTVLAEGETRGYESVAGTTEGMEDNTKRRRWGLKFRCKGA
jgi:hypothetical protein